MRVTVPDTTAWQVVDERVVMLELLEERYFRLNDIGSRMWELLALHGDLETVTEHLASEFEAAPDVLGRDLETLVRELADAGLVAIDDSTPEAA